MINNCFESPRNNLIPISVSDRSGRLKLVKRCVLHISEIEANKEKNLP